MRPQAVLKLHAVFFCPISISECLDLLLTGFTADVSKDHCRGDRA